VNELLPEKKTGGPALAGADRILRATGLSLGYGRGRVLEGVDIEIRRGELWFFIGPNGTGKTTFLKALLGALKPRRGTLELAPELASRRRVGFVPQRCDLKPTLPMTVSEFVLLGLEGTRSGRDEARESLEWALEKTGIAERGRRDYWSLSGGERQRALIARGLVRRPELLILDEPTNGLDAAAEEALVQLVAALNRDPGITVLFVTHVIALAARFASHVALFHEGRVTAGPRGAVLTGPRLREAYGVDVRIGEAG
jgi:zinc transport system ATP-binding protein